MDSPKFQTFFRRLNREQKRAVETIDGPVMVIAGPGTGKTTVLTLRIGNILLKTDTPPSAILAITYTEAGVKAMKQKLREIIGHRANEIPIHTFHSLAVSVIRDYPDHFPLISDAEPLSEIAARALIQDILQDKKFAELRPFGRPTFYLQPILQAISQAKKEALTPEMLAAYARAEIAGIKKTGRKNLKRSLSKSALQAAGRKRIQKLSRTLLLADIYELYEQKKRQAGKIDFDDMIFELELALSRDRLLLRLFQERFLYLLVDEHQDTNDSQNRLILLLAEFFETPNVFIVGDEKQAIYRFQGASVENFLKFQRKWRNLELIQLNQSYRSHQKILDAAFRLIEHNYQGGEHQNFRVKLKAQTDRLASQPITVVKGRGLGDTEEYLVNRLGRILERESQSEIALIVRTNAAVSRLKWLCQSRGLPASAARQVGVFEHPTGRLFFELLAAIEDPLDFESLGRTVAAGLWNFSPAQMIGTLAEIRSGRGIKDRFFNSQLKELRDSLYSGDPLGFLFESAGRSGYLAKVAAEPERLEVWRGILELAETILRSQKNPSDTSALIKELLAYRKLAEEKQVRVVSGEPNARLKIMTAHASKGLEFDYVFLPYATESFWLKKSSGSLFALPFERPSAEEDLKDSRRLFYVALTRAKKHLEILTHAEREGGETDLALRFIEELGPLNVQEKILPEQLRPPARPGPLKIKRLKDGLLAAARRLLLAEGLSVTALNHFLECPNKFLYRSVLKIPDRPSPAAEKGSALHSALAAVFRSGERRPGKIKKILEQKTREYLNRSFLKKSEIENLKGILRREIPLIVGGLKEHFSPAGSVSVEKNLSGQLSQRLETGQKIKIPLHGRLDLLLEEKGRLAVFDYKSRRALSPRAVKGESQSRGASGGYFRQLVFYALLLSQNRRYRQKAITVSLVFLTPDNRGRVKTVSLPVSLSDLNTVKKEIADLAAKVYSGKILEESCSNRKCQWCALRRAADS